MKFFTKEESLVLSIILLIIFSLALFNFQISFRRSRDNQRKNDLGDLQNSLHNFQSTFGGFPPAENGKIKGCTDSKTLATDANIKFNDMVACDWAQASLRSDPSTTTGRSYAYFSDGKFFQVFASLEGKDEDEYNPKIAARHLACGNAICNFGKASGSTPLDKSLEEYENELFEKQKK